MKNYRESILTSFKQGLSINGISSMIYYEMKKENKDTKKRDTKRRVEETILSDYLEKLKHGKEGAR